MRRLRRLGWLRRLARLLRLVRWVPRLRRLRGLRGFLGSVPRLLVLSRTKRRCGRRITSTSERIRETIREFWPSEMDDASYM